MNLERQFVRGIASPCAAMTLLAGVLATLGHALDHDGLARLFLGSPRVLPDTALGLLAAGIAVLGILRSADPERPPAWARAAAVSVLALGLLQAADDVASVLNPLASTRLQLLKDAMGLPAPPQSALGLTLSGLALVLGSIPGGRFRLIGEWLGFAVFGCALLAISGHFFGAFGLVLLNGFAAIPLGALIAFLTLGYAVPLAVGGRKGVVALIFSRTGGGTLLRSVISQSLLLFLIAGWLQLIASTNGWVDQRYGAAFFTAIGFGALFFLMWRTALRINRMEREKQELGEQYRAILKTAPDGVLVCTEHGRILIANHKSRRLFGYSRTELARCSLRDLIPTFNAQDLSTAGTRAPGFGRQDADVPLTARRKDGSEFTVHLSLGVRSTPGGKVVIAIVRDITAKYQQERELQRANRALRLISAITQAVREVEDEESFLQRVCRILVDRGGYVVAWVGKAEPPPECRVRPVASAGRKSLHECLDRMYVTWSDSVHGQGAGGTCIRTGHRFVIGDTSEDPRFAPWRGFAQELGFRSVAAFPLRVDGRIEGALLIYAVMDYFGEAECELLEDLANDMGYAIGALRAANSRNAAETALRRSEANLARAQQIAHLGSWEWNLADNQMAWSEQTFQLFGLQDQEVCPSLDILLDYCHADDRSKLVQTIEQVQQGEVSCASCQFRAKLNDGQVRHLALQAEVEFHDLGPCRVVGVLQDVSQRVSFEEELAKLARYDGLTDLPNRLLLQDRLEQAMSHARRIGRLLALAFVDLDRFKMVNDTLGHDAGDQLLQETARRLVGCLREGDTVARLGGDEFVVVLTDLAKAEDAGMVAHKMLEALRPPVRIADREVVVGASIGIAFFPNDGATLQELMMNADKAMYGAKHGGRGQYRFYDAEINRGNDEWLGMNGSLHGALERGEFELHYQPKFAIGGGTTGVEALLRWMTPDKGMVSPAKFIPLLEETGHIIEVGEWVIREACSQVRRWREDLGCDIPVAVNLSPRQFQQPDLVERVRAILEEEGVAPESLELEITETTVAQNVERAISIMHAFKRLGVRLAIDDFGTGYSSLAALKRFPADCLKIDRSFVQDLPDDPDSGTIARAIVALAHSMRLSVVAEGVETEEQYRFLAECGCDEMQGYLFARPMPAAKLTDLLASRERARSVAEA